MCVVSYKLMAPKTTQNELQFVRIKTKKRELMMGVGACVREGALCGVI